MVKSRRAVHLAENFRIETEEGLEATPWNQCPTTPFEAHQTPQVVTGVPTHRSMEIARALLGVPVRVMSCQFCRYRGTMLHCWPVMLW